MGEFEKVVVLEPKPKRRVDTVAVMTLEPGECVLGTARFLERLVVATTQRVLVEHDDRVMRPLVFEPLGRVT